MREQNFTYEAKAQSLIVHLPKELDHHNCKNLRYDTDLILAEHCISKIIFDFTKTEFMDSSGIGVLLSRYKQMERSGGNIVLYGVKAQAERILSIGGIFRLAVRCATKEEALEWERSKTWKK